MVAFATDAPCSAEVNLRRLLAKCDAVVDVTPWSPAAAASPLTASSPIATTDDLAGAGPSEQDTTSDFAPPGDTAPDAALTVETDTTSRASGARDDRRANFDKARFATNVKHLRRLLNEVEAYAATKTVDRTVLEQYDRRINLLADFVGGLKLTAPVEKCLSHTRLSKFPNQTQADKNMENEKELLMVRRAEEKLKSELLEGAQNVASSGGVADMQKTIANWSLEEKKNELFGNPADSGSKEGLRHRGQVTGDDEEDESQLMAMHQRDQEQLTNNLVGLVGILKQNSQAFGNILKNDEKTMMEAQSLVEGNVEKLSRESHRVRAFTQSSGKTTLLVWGVVLLVCFVSVLMFLFIRIFPK